MSSDASKNVRVNHDTPSCWIRLMIGLIRIAVFLNYGFTFHGLSHI